MRTLGFIVILAAVVLALESCGSHDSEQRAVVEEWMGKEIVIPEDLTFQIQDTPINYDFNNADFKIITYIDSTGCTECRMKLPIWDDIINEFKSDIDTDVNFLMIINTKDIKEITKIVHNNHFNHPICIDSLNIYDQANSLHHKECYHTFLLDRHNRVLAIGNPTTNPKLNKLYARIISNHIEDSKNKDFDLGLNFTQTKSIGVINAGDTINIQFDIINTKNRILTIEDIIPSCNCITGTATSTIINEGEQSKVAVQYIADTLKSEFKRHVDIFFKETEYPARIILHGFIKP